MTSRIFARAMLAAATALVAGGAATAQTRAPARPAAILPATSYTLANGLKVVLHIDRSDPVVAVALVAHVGSARETPGRTGFAHMFEHLFFLDSENLGPGGLDRLSARVGGTGANGFTTRDMTVYLQEVPNDALEKMIWAEADKLGFFIKTVTDPVLAKEKQVVKNEKRQRVDNAPYGHIYEISGKALYPVDHPYHWQVIGSLADLDSATLEDVRGFYRRWYTPNNSTLVITGDFDPARARLWVERYFGEIARGEAAARPALRPVSLAASRSLMYEDDYAKLPLLMLTWPGVGAAHRDAVALELLMNVLSDGRDAPLTRLMVDELKLTDAVGAGHQASTMAGEAAIQVRAFDGVDLDRVRAAIDEGLRRFAARGVDPAALARAKAQYEVGMLGELDSVVSKAEAIAAADATTGDENLVDKRLAAARAVTAADLMRVYRTYLAGKPNVAVSAVPKGRPELALAGAERARLSIEPIVQGAEAAVDPGRGAATYARTPSRIDRRVEPPSGPPPRLVQPAIWQARLANGLALSGIEDRELPTADFALTFDGGQRFDDPARPGAANLVARMMTRGTARRTAAELENAFKTLGAEVSVGANRERITLTGRTLARNFAPTMALVTEMLLEPRWDAAELALAKAAVTARIADNRAEPSVIAGRITDAVTYGPASIVSRDILGTPASVAALTIDDLKRFAAANLAPGAARFRITGAVDRAAVSQGLAPLAARWSDHRVTVPAAPSAAAAESARLYFHDVPDAKQSTLLFSIPGPRRADPDFYPTVVMNYILGGGGFASRLTQELRERRGYTYSIRSAVQGWSGDGRFSVGSAVRANVTLESTELIRQMLRDYGTTFTPADLDVTKAFLTKSRAFAFESPAAKLGLLANIGDYGLPADYPAREAAAVADMTIERIRDLAARTIRPDRMTYVVVGDARTQAKRLDALGLGAPVAANSLID